MTSPYTERLYRRLPQAFRDEDSSGHLLAYLSLLGEQAGKIADLAERFDFATPEEAIDDPRTPRTLWSDSLLAAGDIPNQLLPAGASAFGGAGLTSSTSSPLSGEYCLEVTTNAASYQGMTFAPDLGRGVSAGTLVRCSVWARAASSSLPVTVQVEGVALRVGEPGELITGKGATWNDLTTSWRLLRSEEWTFTEEEALAAHVNDYRPAVRVILAAPAAGKTFYLDDLAVEWQIVTDETTSDLVDPTRADEAWLPWLAQLVGAREYARLPVPDQRRAIAGAIGGWQSGTKEAIASAAATALTGSRYTNVIDHYLGDPWKIGLLTTEGETLDAGDVIAAVEEAHAKPAGYGLVHSYYQPAWDVIESSLPTWDVIEALGTWAKISSVM